jgi:SAM-dependent methyltransferase
MAAAPTRTPAQLRNHYEVEKALADRLKATRTPAERARLYATMYQELFARVPDHPRLTVARDPQGEARQVARLVALLRPHLGPDIEYVEFGAGTCALAFAVASRVRRARAVEIADQIPPGAVRPANFQLVLYDGWNLDIAPASVDLVFSEQFVEHLHPDDARHHFELVRALLRPGGRYLLRTPERWTGPHDVSRWFAPRAQGFHLREWSYAELAQEARTVGFARVQAYWNGRGRCIRVPVAAMHGIEAAMAAWPLGLRRALGHRLIPMVTLCLVR